MPGHRTQTRTQTRTRTRSRTLTRTLIAASLAACAALASACSGGSSSSTAPPEARPEPAAPSAGSPYWVDPDSDAARQVKAWEAQGRTADAKALRRISTRPVADWPAGDRPAPEIEKAVRSAAPDERTVLLVAYNIPHRDCGLYSAGGAPDAAAYRAWLGEFAGAIGGAPATVVLEPDAVSHIVDGCTPAQHHAERERLLAEAIGTLKKNPRTKVYLDAGNPAWIDDPGKLVEPLKRAGVAKADGFSLNVSNFQTTAAVKAYGARLSGLLGGDVHYVVDTSRNGDGPLPGDRQQAWCNPPGRALGTPPTTTTGDELLDSYLWIKRPGDSDGPCRGGPDAGTWWPDYALGLARRAKA